MIAWTSSGSRRSDIAVNPDTSANITVTLLRSPSMALLEVRIFSARCFGVYVTGAASRKAADGPDVEEAAASCSAVGVGTGGDETAAA